MRSGDNLIKTFARCFRLLAKLNAGIKDGFFIGLISKESENLLSEYLKFLKMRGDTIAKNRNPAQLDAHVAQTDILQHRDVVKCRDIAQHEISVAQYHHRELTSRINLVLLLLEIFKHLNLAEITTPPLLERELLKLKLLLLNDSEQFAAVGARATRADDNLKNHQKNKNPKTPVDNLSELNSDRKKSRELGEIHQRIAEFISGKERVQNVEVFAQFATTTRRTLKRKLSELVKAGAIKRLPLGKKVFYTMPNLSEFNSDRLSTGG